ncbi:uncharacterized protein [Aegilops tauschii subsp. strangulata]|nr:uncharacterized protein LOC109753054 isoform X2 [Aegilops tauschii subsp. strangulata]
MKRSHPRNPLLPLSSRTHTPRAWRREEPTVAGAALQLLSPSDPLRHPSPSSLRASPSSSLGSWLGSPTPSIPLVGAWLATRRLGSSANQPKGAAPVRGSAPARPGSVHRPPLLHCNLAQLVQLLEFVPDQPDGGAPLLGTNRTSSRPPLQPRLRVAPLPPTLQYIPGGKRVDSMGDFKVEIDVQTYLTIVGGKRVYRRGKTWDFMVGRDLYVARIKEVVEEKFKWSPDQRMTIW